MIILYLSIGDYVTAVWSDGELCLFKISGFEIHGIGKWNVKTPCVKLERIKGTRAWLLREEDNTQTYIFKSSIQITWVDPEYVLTHILSK